MKPQRIRQGSLILFINKFIGLLLGMSVTVFLARKYGKGAITDAFFAAQLISVGYISRSTPAIASGFIPKFKESLIKESEPDAWKTASSIINLLIITFLIVSVMLFLFSPQVIRLTAPGFGGRRFTEAVGLLKLFTPLLFLTGFTGILSSIAYSYKHFCIPAMGENLPKAGAVLGAVCLTIPFGVKGIVAGMIAGGVLSLLLQLHLFTGYRKFYHFRIDLKDKQVKTILGQFGLLLITVSLTQVNLTIDQIFASLLGTGRLSALSYANRLLNLAAVLLPGSIIMASFPVMSEKMAQNRLEDLKHILQKNITLISFILIPLILLLMAFAENFVAFLFQKGNFAVQDTAMVVKAVVCYAPGIFWGILAGIITPVFYIAYETKWVVIVGIFSCVLNWFLDYVLIKPFDYMGIAVSSSVCALFNLCLLSCILDKRILKLNWGEMASSFGQILTNSLFMIALMIGISRGFSGIHSNSYSYYEIARIGLLLALGGGIYLALSYYTKTSAAAGFSLRRGAS